MVILTKIIPKYLVCLGFLFVCMFLFVLFLFFCCLLFVFVVVFCSLFLFDRGGDVSLNL